MPKRDPKLQRKIASLRDKKGYLENVKEVRRGLPKGFYLDFLNKYYSQTEKEKVLFSTDHPLYYKLRNYMDGVSFVSGYTHDFIRNLEDYFSFSPTNNVNH